MEKNQDNFWKFNPKKYLAHCSEYIEVATEGCSLGPNPVDIAKATAGKTIAIFGVPGAFTPTCSVQHAPGYIESADAFKAAGVDGSGAWR